MKFSKPLLLGAAVGLCLLASAAYAAGLFTNGLPAASSITGSETIPADTNLSGGRAPQSESITVNLLKSLRVTALTDETTVSVDGSTGDLFTLTLSGNHTLGNPTNLQTGQAFYVKVTQDATGGHTLAYGSNYKWASGSAPTITTTGGLIDLLRFVYDGSIIMGDAVQNLQ